MMQEQMWTLLLCANLVLILTLTGTSFCATTSAPTEDFKTIKSTEASLSTKSLPLKQENDATLKTTTSVFETSTKSNLTTQGQMVAWLRSTTRAPYSTTFVNGNSKVLVQSARKQNLNASSSALGRRHSDSTNTPGRLEERLGAIDCDLPLLPNGSRLWRGNETHELNLPVKATGGAGDEDCPPAIVSWEGYVDIQSGDILIVRIVDTLLLEAFDQHDSKNISVDMNMNASREEERMRRLPLQPSVYQVTRQGHEHCDITEGMLLDITPLEENGAKLFTLYDKDLSEGLNLFIVVSKNWGLQCIRLKVTVKSENCGDSQDCSGKGICFTNGSMESYECQCCRGYMGPHCEERVACNSSPCLNNGKCVELTQQPNGVSVDGEGGANYQCLCPYGFTGRNCEKDPCLGSPCLNGGTCVTMAVNGSITFFCSCGSEWTGMRCESFITKGACSSNPCVKGICLETTNAGSEQDLGYSCYCEQGYTGDLCQLEYNECDSSPCANGGTCTDLVNGFECACSRGYNGNTCQDKVDLCSPNPCPEMSICMDKGNNYECQCPVGYIGEECHIPARSPCDNNPCAHGGTCWSGVDAFYCSCRPGYTGKLCEEDFILESVMSEDGSLEQESRGGGSVREVRMPLGLYHDRLHNVYIAAGTLGAAIAIVGVVVTACHCRVNKTYSRFLSRLTRAHEGSRAHHWLQDKQAPSSPALFQPPSAALDTTDMYYTLDFSDSQSSPLIQ